MLPASPCPACAVQICSAPAPVTRLLQSLFFNTAHGGKGGRVLGVDARQSNSISSVARAARAEGLPTGGALPAPARACPAGADKAALYAALNAGSLFDGLPQPCGCKKQVKVKIIVVNRDAPCRTAKEKPAPNSSRKAISRTSAAGRASATASAGPRESEDVTGSLL